MKGLIHIYCGDGKGKTSTALGLLIRAAGSGKRCVFIQFLKDNQSSELRILQNISNIKIIQTDETFGFFSTMSEPDKIKAGEAYKKLLEAAITEAETAEVLILDEVMAAIHYQLISEERVSGFLKEKPESLEVVMTGRNPSEALLELADYISEIKKIRHPYDQGISAREGIEY